MKFLSDRLETRRFSFAKPETMLAVMGVTPGSATPFALMNDTARTLRVVLDEGFLAAKECVFHPLENCYSTVLSVADLQKFIAHLGYEVQILPLS